MKRLILGTAGHIDHGKTALVKALTGTDTDRLPEEKARGITIDLGFAELLGVEDAQVGVVDVPGHEDFVRTMVAGATGLDLVLLVVAADEGVMPQTREHLEIVRLLGIPEMVVALTKIDAADPEWAELVAEEVRGLLADTPFADAPVVRTSARDGTGLDALRAELTAAAGRARVRAASDVARLPVDRVFTVPGRGTVVTGTLWSGALTVGAGVTLLPGAAQGRIRSLQVHGRDVQRAEAGERTAVALAGLERQEVARGTALLDAPHWEPSWMLTVRVQVLRGARDLEHGQRVRVHLGTAEILARCVPLEEERIAAGSEGFVQLRLESPACARSGDRLVLRSYSPLATIGGGVVAEPCPPKRRRLDAAQAGALTRVLGGTQAEAAEGAMELAGWSGVAVEALSQLAPLSPAHATRVVEALREKGVLVGKGRAFAKGVGGEARDLVLAALDAGHREEPLRAVVPLERLRAALPPWAARELPDLVIRGLSEEGALQLAEGGARRPGFVPTPTADQARARAALADLYAGAGLSAPFVEDLPEELRTRADLPQLLRLLEEEGILRSVDAGLRMHALALDGAEREVASRLGGKAGLGPTDFREVLDVSRRHLMALLAYLDGRGVTLRNGSLRDVPAPRN